MTITSVDWNGNVWLGNNADYTSKASMAYNVTPITIDGTFTLQLLGSSIRVIIIDKTNNTMRLATPNDTLSIAIRVFYIPKMQ